MKVVLEVPDGIDPYELKLTLLDAFGEFAANRGPTPEQYVARRYPDEAVYRGEHREKKIAQVKRRIGIANDLHSAVFRAEF